MLSSKEIGAEASERFEIRSKLGAGAMGAVYEAFDRERGSVVALKTLRRMDAAAIYRFKREFRSLADLSHPNLIEFYELLHSGEAWFFTMECVRGEPFKDYVRPGRLESPSSVDDDLFGGASQYTAPTRVTQRVSTGTLDEGRLRGALAQLAQGVVALHQAGKLHRDIKPSNILMTDEGRVVLCDFGLVTESGLAKKEVETTLMGTPAYMAPEQATHQLVDEAADWYSVGVVLYEALTGAVPFRGDEQSMLESKQFLEPPAPIELDPSVPADLSALCAELLRPLPEDRLTGEEVLQRLGASRPISLSALQPSSDSPFVGRASELEALFQAFNRATGGEAVVACVSGLSGMGKTALVRRFLDAFARHNDVLVLEGRCYEQESMPYKALDTVVDALTRALLAMRDDDVDAIMPRDIIALARLFPVLRRVDAVALPRVPVLEPLDPQQSRRRAFAAMRELLTALSRDRVLVLSIDDLQWGDIDSADLLLEILRPPDPPRMLLVASYRSEDATTSPFLRAFLQAHADHVGVEVQPMKPAEVGDLMRALVPHANPEVADAARVSVGSANGNPYLVTEVVRYLMTKDPEHRTAPVTIEQMLQRRLAVLDDASRRLIQVLAVAGRPIEQRIARRAASLEEAPEAAISMLRKAHLLRTSGVREQDSVEMYHDRVRQAVVSLMAPDEMRTWHRRLALALEAANDSDLEALATHFHAAGETTRAGKYALAAARQAEDALAFARAARMYEFVLGVLPLEGREASGIRARLANALGQIGRGADAAHAYLDAAEGAYVADALEYRRRAAEHLLHSGHVDEGMRTIEQVLDALGMKLPRTPRRALFRLLLRRARLRLRGLRYVERDPSQIAPEVLRRIDVCWSVAAGLGMVDTWRGMEFQTRHIMFALRSGDRTRLARAIASEGMFVSADGHRQAKRSERLCEHALKIARASGDAATIGFVNGALGLRSYQLGDFQRALDYEEYALDLLHNRCTGVSWELDTADLVALWSMFYMGRFTELVPRVHALIRGARERGDLFAETSLSVGLPNAAWLADDDPAGARRVCDDVMDRWSHRDYHLQHYWAWVARRQTELYEGRCTDAWAAVGETWPDIRRALFLRIQAVRIEATCTRGRAALGAAIAAGDRSTRAALLKAARADAGRLAREASLWGRALGRLLAAGVAAAGGDARVAVTAYRDARAKFDDLDMAMHAAVAMRRRGELLGGDEGEGLISSADRRITSLGIANPERMAAMVAPKTAG